MQQTKTIKQTTTTTTNQQAAQSYKIWRGGNKHGARRGGGRSKRGRAAGLSPAEKQKYTAWLRKPKQTRNRTPPSRPPTKKSSSPDRWRSAARRRDQTTASPLLYLASPCADPKKKKITKRNESKTDRGQHFNHTPQQYTQKKKKEKNEPGSYLYTLCICLTVV